MARFHILTVFSSLQEITDSLTAQSPAKTARFLVRAPGGSEKTVNMLITELSSAVGNIAWRFKGMLVQPNGEVSACPIAGVFSMRNGLGWYDISPVHLGDGLDKKVSLAKPKRI